MVIRSVAARLDGDGMRFVATTGSCHTVVMDDTDGDSGPRPAELLMVAQAGCTAMDVIGILRKKRQAVTSYEVRVTGAQRDDRHPHVFQRIRIVHVVEGAVEVEALRRAIELSATRYCTVSANLASGRGGDPPQLRPPGRDWGGADRRSRGDRARRGSRSV